MKKIFSTILKNPTLCARFLNTLSLLEYIGARKILKSQTQDTLTDKMLAHAQEEIRHAYRLKRAALKYDEILCQTYAQEALLCGEEACDYFQTVDRAVEKIAMEGNTKHAYLYTTYLIETRAISLYTLLENLLLEHQQAPIFNKILVEEEHHLEEILQHLNSLPQHAEKIQQLEVVEAEAFDRFVAEVRDEVFVVSAC